MRTVVATTVGLLAMAAPASAAVDLRINFQPAGATVPAGYAADAGAAYDATRGSGWIRQDSLGTTPRVPLDMSTSARERNLVADQRLDTHIAMQLSGKVPGAWEIDVPTGSYSVTVAVGDPQYFDSTHRINVEGQTAISGFVPSSSSPFATASRTVTVSDGRLTVDALGGTNTKLAYVTIVTAGDTVPPAAPSGVSATAGDGRVSLTWTANTDPDLAGYKVYRSASLPVSTAGTPVSGGSLLTTPSFTDTTVTNGVTYHYVVQAVDGSGNAASAAPVSATPQAVAPNVLQVNFQPATAPVPSGYAKDGGLAYDAARGYGWMAQSSLRKKQRRTIDMSAYARDRNVLSDQRLDTLIHMQPAGAAAGAWEAALANGSYTVTVAVGDPSALDSTHAINVEGQVLLANFVPTSTRRFMVASRTVNVADGRLTVDAIGGRNTKINYVEVAKAGALPRPSVRSTDPPSGAMGVPRDTPVTVEVVLPNVGAGIDTATLSSSSVRLERVSDGALVPATVNTSGGGDVIVLQPNAPLAASTQYRFVVTSALRDVAGAAFMPWTGYFTTGTEGGGGSSGTVSFSKVALSTAVGRSYTSLVIGPDRKLYAGTLDGEIVRFPISADGATGNPEVLSSLQAAEGGGRHVIGLAFDPAATASNLVLWVSHSYYAFSNAPDWSGKISRLSGSTLGTVKDYVVGLPRSIRDHETNSLAFGPDGALYVAQGSNTAMGASDSAWGLRPERVLSAAILRVNTGAITAPPVNVKTEEGGSYDPFAASAPVKLHATGVRNAFDLVWHTNGELYVPANGSAAGGNTPATPATLPSSCQRRIDAATAGAYTGPSVPGLTNVGTAQADFLFRVRAGGYYGHPNPTRCEWVLNGGDPTSGADPVEVAEYSDGVRPDRNWRGVAYTFGNHYSPNGVIEYRSSNFGGALKGKLLVARYSAGDDIVALTPGGSALDIVGADTSIPGFGGLTDPLDIVEDRSTGNVYVSELGASRIVLLRAAG